MARRAHNARGDLLEAPFMGQIIGLARFYGWRVAHFRTSRTGSGGYATAVQADGAGYPDLVLVRGAELLFVEVKTRTGRLSRLQQEWIAALKQVELALDALPLGESPDAVPRVEVLVWRPGDWDAVEERLSRGRRRVPAAFDPRR